MLTTTTKKRTAGRCPTFTTRPTWKVGRNAFACTAFFLKCHTALLTPVARQRKDAAFILIGFFLFIAENLHNVNKGNSLARSNASLYGNKEELYDRLRRHAYQGKKGISQNENVPVTIHWNVPLSLQPRRMATKRRAKVMATDHFVPVHETFSCCLVVLRLLCCLSKSLSKNIPRNVVCGFDRQKSVRRVHHWVSFRLSFFTSYHNECETSQPRVSIAIGEFTFQCRYSWRQRWEEVFGRWVCSHVLRKIIFRFFVDRTDDRVCFYPGI